MNTDKTTITWIDATAELPDDEMTVLVALESGEVWTGFRDGGWWRYVSADLIGEPVTHWAEFTAPPIRVNPCPSVVKNRKGATK